MAWNINVPETDHLRQVVDGALANRKIIARDGPPHAWFTVGGEKITYQIIRGRGGSASDARRDFLASMIGMVPNGAKALAWRIRPEIALDGVWCAYGRLAFLQDAADLDRMSHDLAT